MMIASLPVPIDLKPVLYRASDEDAPRQVKVELRDLTATVAAGLEPVEGGILQRGNLVFEIRHVARSPRPGFLDLQLRQLGVANEPEPEDQEDDA